MYVIILHSGQKHVSASNVAFFRVLRTGVKLKCVQIAPQFNKIYIWIKFKVE
jgi:hypothetical protein